VESIEARTRRVERGRVLSPGGGYGEGLVFVGGCPRSGTTLVQLVLDSHPRVCGGPEFHHVADIVELRRKLRESVASGRISAYCSSADVDREIGLLVEGLLKPYAEERKCEVISEKTPWDVLIFEELLEILPRARFIFCMRDPRAVVASMLQVGQRAKEKGQDSPGFTRRLSSAVDAVKTINEAGFRVANESDRVLTVVYERLLEDPEQETMRICDFMGLPWSEEMVRPGEKKHDGGKLLDGVWYTDGMYHSDLEPSRAHKWREHLSTSQRATVAAAFKDDENLKSLGYELSDEPASAISDRIAKVRLEARSRLENLLPQFASLPMKSTFLRRLVMQMLSSLRAAERRQRHRTP
jgi:protein-tyrosine sulfotransferase